MRWRDGSAAHRATLLAQIAGLVEDQRVSLKEALMGWIVELEAEGRYRLPHGGRRGPLGRALYSLWCGVESLLLGESVEEILPLIDDEFLETSCSEDYESSSSEDCESCSPR